MPAYLDPGWRDVADILAISYLAHRVLLLARGTRALQATLALAALWALGQAARRAGLELTGWALGAVNALAPIALIVAFRDEIREVLIRSSPLRLLAGRPPRAGAIDPELVAEAAFRLAASQTGALLVLQGRDRLDRLARAGERIDARFIVPLVESLFAKGSPVHDGAAIVKGGRIARVGTLLPLSTRDGLPAEFGTRHRAAVGLSERCDAVVLVVSEERGAVTLARHGRVERIASPEELEESLGEHLLRGEERVKARRGRLAGMASSAAGFLLTALAVAALWALYNRQQVAQRTVTAAVNFSGLPESLELVDPPEEVDLRLRGKRTLIDGLSPEGITASVDLSGADRGGVYELERGDMAVELPAGVDWSTIEPSFRVELVERVEVTVPVRTRLEGRPPPGFEFAARAEPPTVRLRVPPRVAERLEAVETRPIDVAALGLDAASPQAEVEVPLELGRHSARPSEGSADTVRVTVELRPAAPPGGPSSAP